MDKKSIIIVAASLVLLFLLSRLTNTIWPPVPAPHLTNQVALKTNITGSSTQAVATTVTNQPVLTPPAIAPLVASNAPESLVEIETDEARFIFTSHGGGLKVTELKGYPEITSCKKIDRSTNRVHLNAAAPVPIMAVLGGELIQGDGLFQLTRNGNVVRAEKTLTNGLRIIKEFTVSSNYLITVKLRLENQSGQPLALPAHEVAIGTASILGARDDRMKLGAYWFNGEKKQSVEEPWFENKRFGCGVLPSTPRSQYLEGNNNVAWADVHSQFFTIGVVPTERASQIRVVRVELPAPATNTPPATGPPFGLQTTLVYPAALLSATQAVDREFTVYTGPKEYKRLTRLSARLKTNIDAIMDYEGFFGWFAQVLLSSMNALHGLGLDYAMCIIAITVIIKLLFWPLTNASTKSMKRMAALQPQMKAIQEKYKESPQKMNREMMDFMKKNKVSPLGGCLPMLLQIPVFFGFFRMIQSAIELRGERFLWVCDLSKADTIFVMPGLNIPINPLPLIMGVTMLWQARLTPPSPGMDPVQQRIMKYMPLMFLFILYNFSAGLTLYWTVQNLLTIAQMKLTKAKDAPGTAPAKAPAGPPPKKRN